MSTPPEHRPTEPQPVVSTSTTPTPSSPPEPTAARSRGGRIGGPYDPVARIAQVIIAAVLVILLLLILGGYKFHVTVEKPKGGRNHSPKITHSPKHSP